MWFCLNMIDNLKNFLLNNKKIIFNIIFPAGLMFASLVLSYNGYKEYIKRSFDTFPAELKISIKAAFPWAILVFVALYILYNIIWRGRKVGTLSLRQHIIILILHAVIINIIFFSKGIHILIVLNLALIIYLVFFLIVWAGINRLGVIDTANLAEEFLPPIIYKSLQKKMPSILAYFKEKPSALFIIGFMFLLIICTILLMLKLERTAKELANIAYFLLVIGVGIEVYRFIKYGERDDKK